MKKLNPIDYLQSKLKRLEKDLIKSSEMYKDGKIKRKTHISNCKNIKPKIKDFKTAIKILKYYKPKRNAKRKTTTQPQEQDQ